MAQDEIERTQGMLHLIQRMKLAAFEPDSAAVIAIGALRTDVQRDPKDMIKDFEDLLATTKTLGLRNAIRMTLKDLYRERGDKEKVLETLHAMIKENDVALQEQAKVKKKTTE
jgi:lipopolysaccharide biosynthesis regulator YciM